MYYAYRPNRNSQRCKFTRSFIVSYKLNTNTGDKKYYNDCREFYVIHCYNNIKEMKRKIIMDMFGIFIDNWWN